MSANAACVVAPTGPGVAFPRSYKLNGLGRLRVNGSLLTLALATALIVALGASCSFVWTQSRLNRADLIARAVGEIDVVATLAALELSRAAETDGTRPPSLDRIVRTLPASVLAGGRTLLLADSFGTVVSSLPAGASQARTLSGLLGDAQPLIVFADRAGVMSVRLTDGSEALATVRGIRTGHLVLLQPVADVLSGFDTRMWSEILIGALAVGICAALGALCFVQVQRTRSAQRDRDRVTRRLDTSLLRGRCGLWDWDVARGRIAWSDSMYDLLGYERRDQFLSFGELSALIHPGDVDLYAVAEDVASLRVNQVDCEFRIRTAAGAWVWLRTRSEAMHDAKDGTRHLVGIAVDVTDERGRFEQNVAADMRLRDAVEAISEAFVLWDADNRLVLCNSKFRNLHHLSGEAVVPGASYSEIMEAGRPPVVEHQLSQNTCCPSGARSLEAQLADGRWLQINERRTKDGGFVSVGTDITTLKRNEAQLLRSESRLLNTVADLRQSREILEIQKQQLADLAERNLDQKSEAESANRSKTEFLAKMSHELRTPLNAIINFADIMQNGMFGQINTRYAEYSKDIHASGLYLLSVINDILDMSRLEAGRTRLDAAPIALAGAITRAVGMISDHAREKEIAVSVCTRDAMTVLADERALHQMLANILQNAVKFTPRGGAINVRLRRAGDAVNIFLEDSGIGIPHSALAKIGRPFEQVEGELSRSHRGSGLGLAIARSLTELHGGNLRIRSQTGVGTIVMIHLPSTSQMPLAEQHASRSQAA